MNLQLDIVTRHQLDRSRKHPVLLYVHGGGWMLGSKETNGFLPVSFVAAMGWVVVTANYRCGVLQLAMHACCDL